MGVHAVVIGIETEVLATRDTLKLEFVIIQNMFNVWYILELILRFLGEGRSFVKGSNWKVNLIDGVLVCTSLVDIITQATVSQSGSIFYTLSLFRAIRAVRILRLVRFVQEL